MPENREALLVMRRFKVPVANDTGVLTVIREFKPGEFLPRADWDRFPARSRRSMINTGFVRDPLNVSIDAITQQPEATPAPRESVTIQHPKRRYDATGHLIDKDGVPRGISDTVTASGPASSASIQELQTEPPKRKRGRPRKVRV